MENVIKRDRSGTPLLFLPFSVALGNVNGHKSFSAIGERSNINVATNGEDITELVSTTMPIPNSGGVQMSIKSTSVEDNAAGSGVREVEIHYLDANGLEQEEVVIPVGSGTVNTVATDITFVNDLYGSQVGSNGVAKGNIFIHAIGSAGLIYNQINANGNQSLVINKKVPSNYTYYITNWSGSVNGAKLMSVRLRATCNFEGDQLTGAFLFKKTFKTGGDSVFFEPIDPPVKICSGAIVKATAWAEVQGNDASISFNGVLIQNS